ncbi:S8 family serine peptidase [Candidatus Sumerlaeota bacterium]|nr:S8 family serine peptidase [Candidatus Sumerlaeota bacterium]
MKLFSSYNPIHILCGLILSFALCINASAEIKRDAKGREYFSGAVIVKLKSSAITARSQGDPKSMISAAPSLQPVMREVAARDGERLFHFGDQSTRRLNASQQALDRLSFVYRVALKPDVDELAAADIFMQSSDVEYAEPLYVYRLCFTPNDPLFSQQWHLHNTGQYKLEDADIDAPEAWDINQGSANPVIAIIDTGVDMAHEDLANQIWINSAEQPGDANGDGRPGVSGFDDDGDGLIDEDSQGRQPGDSGYTNDLSGDDDENGYVDDYYGWNWIDENNNPTDDNGHGTHCAGIAAAETDNGAGIAGVCPNARIMPLKAFQSNGTASNEDIALAVEYAWRNGAQVISMSFSGPESSLVEDALALAYSQAVLVAAAGNGGESEGYRYPAHYSFVIGVGASDVDWDDEHGVYEEVIAEFTNTLNTDICAPGVNIRSTLPGDQYAAWSGTSMATPIVAGVAGLLVSEKTGGFWGPDLYQGQIINCSDQIVEKIVYPVVLGYARPTLVQERRIDAVQVLTNTPAPMLTIESTLIDDSVAGDGNGLADSGESFDLIVTLRNQYGNAEGVTATLSTSDSMAIITDAQSSYGNIGPSASDDNSDDPFAVQISSEAGNNRVIILNLSVEASNSSVALMQSIEMTIQRGTEVSGELTTDTTWTSSNLYIVTSVVHVPNNIKLTIEPGTTVKFNEDTYIRLDGTMEAMGTTESMILLTANTDSPSFSYWNGIQIGPDHPASLILDCCIVEYAVYTYDAYQGHDYGSIEITRCILRNNRYGIGYHGLDIGTDATVRQCIITDNYQSGLMDVRKTDQTRKIEGNLVMNNGFGPSIAGFVTAGISLCYIEESSPGSFIFKDNAFFNNRYALTCSGGTNGVSVDVSNNYWGTTDTAIIDEVILDYYDTFLWLIFDYTPILDKPSNIAPPYAYRVDLFPSSVISAETATFNVLFNKPMNTQIQPIVTFGPEEPYTQHPVTDGEWITSTTWRGEYPITIFTGDGIHNIRIAGARDAELNFEAPTVDHFQFEIDTVGLSGVNLQASGEAGRVDLSFQPVEEPDLAGYNIYRADTAGGTYAKLNSAVVVDNAYSDYTAPEGVTKYYQVTAVRTDFTESDPSDTASAAALDGTPPTLTHTPVTIADYGGPGVTIQATVSDVSGLQHVTLHYKAHDEASYVSVAMNNPSGDLYSYNIPASYLLGAAIHYYIDTADTLGNDTSSGSEAIPHVITISGAPSIGADASALDFGDDLDQLALAIWNDGGSTLNYTVSVTSGSAVFSVAPDSGSSTGSDDECSHTVTVDRSAIAAGSIVTGVLSVEGNSANSPYVIELTASRDNAPPTQPQAGKTLAVVVTVPSIDNEGAEVTYTVRWQSDADDDILHIGLTAVHGVLCDVLTETDASSTEKTWTVTVTPSDGDQTGSAAAVVITGSDSMDVNGDGTVDVGDVMMLINQINGN